MTVTVFANLILLISIDFFHSIDFLFTVFSLGLVSIDKIYQALKKASV